VGGIHGRRVPPPPNEDDDDDKDYHVVNEEADVAMEDAAPPRGGDVLPGAGDLPPEYQALVAGGYDEEALLQQVLEASKADEDKAYPGYNDLIALTGMVAEHVASLPPPPPLPPRAPLLATYEGREVPPSPGVLRRRHDHPHRVVINPPPQPQQEVFINLVSDDDE
jgi:hypothetical protein